MKDRMPCLFKKKQGSGPIKIKVTVSKLILLNMAWVMIFVKPLWDKFELFTAVRELPKNKLPILLALLPVFYRCLDNKFLKPGGKTEL